MRYEAEARGIRQVLESKAAGYESLVRSTGGDARAAATLLMIEKLEDIVGKQVEAIQNLKIDKITVWDSGAGGGGNGQGSSTAKFLSSLVGSLPPLQEIAKMAGVELPEYLGRMTEPKTNGGPNTPREP
jgi:flotillin